MKISIIKVIAVWSALWSCGIMAQTSTKHYYYTDPQGTVLAKADEQGNIVERYDYAPYGTQVLGTPPEGPAGYTGHVNDGESGLVYMQARYYDPTAARFLGVDPEATAAGNPFNFNRYAYANNNSIANIDPDGREVRYAISGGVSMLSPMQTMAYLSRSKTFRSEYNIINNAQTTYTIVFSNQKESSFNWKTNVITINPTEGLIVKSSGRIQSPALGGGHEIVHAADNERMGDKEYSKAMAPPTMMLPGGTIAIVISDPPVGPAEEERATKVESQIASELGEPSRKYYYDQSGVVTTCGPTSNQTCSK